ncbi:hypothetical protein AbraCBS73388_006885 [Aspergillus brasiliensis]|uniref:Mannan endo-1,6-alpha-mannosidase n=1 Tax=Aspergillus brasiliensis TaxID=319629 RepID=A0A9W5YRI7_9EURO|nr:hypothetical protein AbraCBS73388_006885 [Aspergillus brasiliensis]
MRLVRDCLYGGLFLNTALFSQLAHAIDIDISSTSSIKDAASKTAYGSMTWYHGNETGQIPGAFPTKWWEGSALFTSLLLYWYYTGDSTYNDEVRQVTW